MIHDSSPWKIQLACDADLIERWAAKPRLSERRSFLMERKVFLAAYSMRKLDEAAKLSTTILSAPVEVIRFAPTQSGFSEINNHRFDSYFDLTDPEPYMLPGRRLMNILIHSLVFVEVSSETSTYDAFMVTSDREREKGLVQVQVGSFVALMRLAADDHPSTIQRKLDPKSGRWSTWAGHGEPP
jgi:hypothetical protein